MTDPDTLDIYVSATMLFGIGLATSIFPFIAPISIPAMIAICAKMRKSNKEDE